MRIVKEGKSLWSQAIDCVGNQAGGTKTPCGSSLIVIHIDLFLATGTQIVAFRCLICGCITEVPKYTGPVVTRSQAPSLT